MKTGKIKMAVCALAALLALPLATPQAQALDSSLGHKPEQIAEEAYIYGYPLVTMEMTRRVMTNVEEMKGSRGPMGQLTKLRAYPDAKFRDVTAPNADTLYTITWLDLAKEPWILTVPDSQGRYYMLPMLSGWTDVFEVPGTRTTGNGPQKFVITGPGWKGSIPKGFKELKAPTAIVWMLGRLYSTGTPEDFKATHAMQDAMELMPLSAYGKPYTPPAAVVDPTVDMKTPVRDQVHNMNAQTYYTLLAELLKTNPPAEADKAMVEKLAKIGLVPGERFAWSKVDPAMQTALDAVIKPTQGKLFANFANLGESINGWTYTRKTGTYGTDYLGRATITLMGLGANRPEDAVYPTSDKDADGNAYSGANKYVMHFDKGQLPPADAFWSLTMYDEGYFFSDNELDRYNVSSRSEFVKNADGSVDVYIQHENPGKDKEANWLPAPEGKFVLMLRLYMPSPKQPSILDGSWKIPPVKNVSANQPSASTSVINDGVGAKSGRVENMHLTRFIEIFFAHSDAKTGKLVAECYNTMFTAKGIPASKDTAPQALVEGLDFAKMKTEYGVLGASLNGPKLWTSDWTEIEIGVEREFNGLKAAWVAQLSMGDNKGGVSETTPYKPFPIARKSALGWNKGTTVLLLDDAEGNTWVMKGFQMGLKPQYTYEQFVAAGQSQFKKLPPGWKFRVKTLDRDLNEKPEGGIATIMADEFFNVYDKTGPGMSDYKP